jgi:hypothetical protein
MISFVGTSGSVHEGIDGHVNSIQVFDRCVAILGTPNDFLRSQTECWWFRGGGCRADAVFAFCQIHDYAAFSSALVSAHVRLELGAYSTNL